MRLIKLIFLFGCLTTNSLFAQSNFTDVEAINIFKTYPPKSGFEGVYEIYYRSKLSIDENVTDAMIEGQNFTSENLKFCLYTTPNGTYGKVVDLSTSITDYNFFKTWLENAQFKLDLYGTLTYNVYWSLKNGTKEQNTMISAKVSQKSETLFWDFTRNDLKYGKFVNTRIQFLLKKIYSPDGIHSKPETGSVAYGTSFLINKKGYLITNYHVVENARKIYIQLNSSNKIECMVIGNDKESDLTLLKVKDGHKYFAANKSFKFNFKTVEVGSEVFTLGYPLIDKMGSEIKVTTGIISSSTGYQGDKSTYQISAPIQPGNSGGPLFNNYGEVIGITNSKLKGAENASYAIKSLFLKNLISNEGISFNTSTDYINVSTLTLPQKIKVLKTNVFIVSCEY
jgi:S1-C subfamily serine protease